MRSPANLREHSTQVVDRCTELESARTSARTSTTQNAAPSAGRSDETRLPPDAPTANSNPGVLGASLQRLYDSQGNTGVAPLLVSQSQPKKTSQTIQDLTESLLEAVFEISEFDPLPHVNYRDEEFSFGLLAGSSPHPAPAKNLPSKSGSIKSATGPFQGHLSTSPDALPGMDRRKLPRRESECVVSICRCRGDERLTPDRIAWMLHSTKLKGQLIDVSMSGVALHLLESLAAGSRILLRISNRTLDKQVDASATILRSREARDGGYDMVCRFEKNLTFEQIHTVGRSLFAATIV